ncbi:kinase-like domain-containing protein [Rhizophagus diaphanus]|nr:kinase-like domain-containing protein [Rhizophagus diaphanus] [Rhizophagus sp. MUCL 43196]
MNIEPLDSGACSEILSATWTKGLTYDFRDNQFARKKDIEIEINFKAKRAGFGVVPCYGITCNKEGYMLVLIRMDKNMSNYLEENHPLSRQQIDNILWSLSSRLCQLHKANIIHNDLHPGNFMIGKGGEWNLIDLGFSLTNDENRRRHGDLDSKESDIYTFAAMMCEVITGCPLKLDNSDYPILPTGIPAEYRKIIEMCLDPEPNKRPKSVSLVCFFRAHMEEYS